MERKKPPFEVNIDFDEASEAWMRNKVKIERAMGGGTGMYRYCCGHIKKNGEKCKGYPVLWSKIKHMKLEDQRNTMRGWGPCRHHSHLYDKNCIKVNE